MQVDCLHTRLAACVARKPMQHRVWQSLSHFTAHRTGKRGHSNLDFRVSWCQQKLHKVQRRGIRSHVCSAPRILRAATSIQRNAYRLACMYIKALSAAGLLCCHSPRAPAPTQIPLHGFMQHRGMRPWARQHERIRQPPPGRWPPARPSSHPHPVAEPPPNPSTLCPCTAPGPGTVPE